MSSNHRQLSGGRAGAWRTLLVVAALGAVTILPSSAAAEAPLGVTGVILLGPTGARSGVPVEDTSAMPDVTAIPPFDTYGRDPQLGIAGGGDEGWVSWQVEAVPASDPAADPVSLAAGVAEVPIETIDLAAPAPGDWLVTAELVAGTGGPSGTWAWHLVIPDRSLPDAMPAPDVVLFGGGGTVIADCGSGCYLAQCGDIGQVPPDRSLPAVRLDRPDEPIALTLSDGSGIVGLNVVVTLLGVGETTPVSLVDDASFAATNVVLIPAPPSPGTWRLEFLLTFSDGRGDQAGYARVIVP